VAVFVIDHKPRKIWAAPRFQRLTNPLAGPLSRTASRLCRLVYFSTRQGTRLCLNLAEAPGPRHPQIRGCRGYLRIKRVYEPPSRWTAGRSRFLGWIASLASRGITSEVGHVIFWLQDIRPKRTDFAQNGSASSPDR